MKKKLLSMFIVMLFVLALVGCSLELRAEVPYTSPIAYEQLRIDMIAEVSPSVVVVKTETGHGSGIIYKSETLENNMFRYYIMTNAHVVEDGGEMTVHFGDVIDDISVVDFASNPTYDIAVVRIETTEVLRVHHVASIDDNTITQIIVGQDVYAIGTPQNIDKFNYVTQGIVSIASYPYNGVPGLVIMHDAELNPGNSGGPLFNLNGELIGINVAKVANISTVEGTIAAEGLNYTLSINKIAPIVRGFTNADFEVVVRKPRLGITVQEISVFLESHDASLLPENPVGVVVIGFDLTRNAHLVLEEFDLIVEMNGTAITSIADIALQLEDAEFGDVHVIKVLRNVDGTFVEFVVNITLS
ncbi:MAG: S1C family serine protease [Acholeplasmataceae bacterium]|nr:S1C family serine protease [Acholeplasmataceae bacterium]